MIFDQFIRNSFRGNLSPRQKQQILREELNELDENLDDHFIQIMRVVVPKLWRKHKTVESAARELRSTLSPEFADKCMHYVRIGFEHLNKKHGI